MAKINEADVVGKIFVCESTALLHFAEKRKLADWNELHDLIWGDEFRDANYHWWCDSCIITKNFFNPAYQDDAYGLLWNEKLREVVIAFMEHHNVEKILFLNGKNHNTFVL